jgi:hypothetical protein
MRDEFKEVSGIFFSEIFCEDGKITGEVAGEQRLRCFGFQAAIDI